MIFVYKHKTGTATTVSALSHFSETGTFLLLMTGSRCEFILLYSIYPGYSLDDNDVHVKCPEVDCGVP